jgi:hypothetical protein
MPSRGPAVEPWLDSDVGEQVVAAPRQRVERQQQALAVDAAESLGLDAPVPRAVAQELGAAHRRWHDSVDRHVDGKVADSEVAVLEDDVLAEDVGDAQGIGVAVLAHLGDAHHRDGEVAHRMVPSMSGASSGMPK